MNYGWDAKTKLAKVSISQNQKLSADVLLFNFPLTVRFKSKTAITDHPIIVRNKTEDFYFSLPEAPRIVRLDPDYTLLAKIKFNVPDAMLHAQLADTNDLAGRLFAIEQLAGKKDLTTAAKLKETLQGDPFYGVRIEAARALRAIHSDEAFSALADSWEQADARVRLQVTALAGFYRDEGHAPQREVLSREQNQKFSRRPSAASVRSEPETSETLLRYLNSDSYRNELAETAVAAIRAQADSEYAGPLLDTLKRRAIRLHEFWAGPCTRHAGLLGLPRAVEGRNPRLHRAVHQDKKRSVQLAAISALGTLEDAKAIPSLETFAGAGKESPERNAAERPSLPAGGQETRRRFAGPAQRGSELQKQNRDLRKGR